MGNGENRRRSVNDAQTQIDPLTRGKAVIQTRCGFKEIVNYDGWLEETKAMIAEAYEVWRKKNFIPRYAHWHHEGALLSPHMGPGATASVTPAIVGKSNGLLS